MSINRSAEAMTIFAVICAAMFPLLHMGRLWIGLIWVLPLPNTNNSWWKNLLNVKNVNIIGQLYDNAYKFA